MYLLPNHKLRFSILILSLFTLASCSGQEKNSILAKEEQSQTIIANIQDSSVIVGAERCSEYINQLKGKQVAVVVNQTSIVGNTHLIDTLLSLGIHINTVFAPEHGFRGDHHAGANIDHSIDQRTKLPIFSLHGKTKKPTKSSLKNVDVVLFDIQDVGVRFYTYISTLHYVMEACAEEGIPLILLDRPNPNGHYVDGPVLRMENRSFVGMHPVPVVYGMTIGEYAQMINGEYWLQDSMKCDLQVIELEHWNHKKVYELPIAPSPNLPNQTSIYLYPSLCFFEATVVSIGRGTEKPFQIYGHPSYPDTSFSFIPKSIEGKSKYPKLENRKCYGVDLSKLPKDSLHRNASIDWSYFQEMFSVLGEDGLVDRKSFLHLLLGQNLDVSDFRPERLDELKVIWDKDLDKFEHIRVNYLLYK